MKLFESVGKGLVIWVMLSLLLKCSVVTFDTVSALNKVGKEETYYERKAYQIS